VFDGAKREKTNGFLVLRFEDSGASEQEKSASKATSIKLPEEAHPTTCPSSSLAKYEPDDPFAINLG